MPTSVQIWRDEHGVPHVEAESEAELYWGHGFVHATDRGMQMLLMRILGQGRLAELLDPSDASVEIDRFFRRANWAGHTQTEVDSFPEEIRTCLQHYCDGANAALSKKCPWEFKVLGYRPEPWRPDDSIMISRMVGYLTLQQSQAEMERLLVEMVQAGVTREKLEELFPDLLDGLDIELLRGVRLTERVVPPGLFGTPAPRMMASNNWVIAGTRTASGKPILTNDPHLEGNRIPAVWAEIVLHLGDRYVMGGSMPGAPGVLIGRNPDVAWGATYAFMDAVDSWIERCRDGRCYREPDQWVPFQERREVIVRKRREPIEVAFYENEHGVLDGDPHREGLYLATRWSAGRSGAKTTCQFLRMLHVRSVEEGMDALGQVESSWNFVLADRHGNIGYQMSGLLPRRRDGASGLVPLPGWQPENDWRGFVPHDELPRVLNPPQGFFATANNDLNCLGKTRPINLPMGPYRADRIGQLLGGNERFTSEDVFAMHFDVYSLQAARYMDVLRPLLPETPQGRILGDWDCRYTADSQGAYLFELFYRGLFREVFGQGGLGESAVEHLAGETGVFVDFYGNFDRILLSTQSAWFRGESREAIYRRVAAGTLAAEPRPWGEAQQYTMTHLLLGGKLPRFLGFDRGPITAIGGRATVHQGQVYRSGNRVTTFVPSFRLVIDMATDEARTNLQGGPSDRRFSRWYCSDLENWLKGRYKTVCSAKKQNRFPFP